MHYICTLYTEVVINCSYSQQGATNNNLCQADWLDLPNNVSSQQL